MAIGAGCPLSRCAPLLIRIGKDPPDRVVSIYCGILAYMYLYRALHPNQSIIFLAIFAEQDAALKDAEAAEQEAAAAGQERDAAAARARDALARAAAARQKAAAAFPDPDDDRDSHDVATHVYDPDRAAFDNAVALLNLHAQAVAVNIRSVVHVILDVNSGNYARWREPFVLAIGKYSLQDHILSDAASPGNPDWAHMDCVVRS